MSWRRFSAIRTLVYVGLTPVAYLLGWLSSVRFVSLLSIVALVESAIAAWRSDAAAQDNGGSS